jgi:PAS domain S-box-containing protein
MPSAPQVRGVVFLAFTEAFRNLNLLAAEDVNTLISGMHYNGWYPLARLQQIFTLIEATYATPRPILEKVGMEFINTLYHFRDWRHLFASGIDFLKTHVDSKMYYNFIQGDPQRIGSIVLVSLEEAAGRAIMHSTTPFSKDFERGVFLRGLQLTRSFDYVQVDNTQDTRIYHIEFLRAAPHAQTPLSTIAAQDFLGATQVTDNRLLAGPELQKVFWHYKQLQQELARQQEFWEATNTTLVQAFLQLRAQERTLHEQTVQLAQAHATSEMLKAGVIDAVPDAIITINEASEIVEFNTGAAQIFGYQRADVLGRVVTDVLIPSYLHQCYQEWMQRYLATGESSILGRRVETEAMHADGHLFPIELTITEVRLATRRVFTAYIRDITERQHMERALRDSEQRFRSLAEVHPVPLGIVSLESGRFLYVSPGLAGLVGCRVEELLGREPGIFADPGEREAMREKLRTMGAVDVFEFTLRKADGSTIPAGITARRMVYEGVNATVGAIVDLTERKRAEAELTRQREALYQSEKLSALGSLLAGVAHEINNPLSVVVGRAIMLEEEAPDPETVAAAGKIRQAAERCTRIVKTFLAMARQQQPEHAPVNLNALITAALDLVGYGLRTTGVTVRLDLAPGLPEVLADASQLHQVFTNLFVNAQQALLEVPEPRWLHIVTRWKRQARVLSVAITDNGPGVPEPIRWRIFDPFFTTKPMGVGTGVGLSLSHGIITAHGGTITLENPLEGGARFVITLPSAPAAASSTTSLPEVGTPGASHTILIVDDEPEVAAMLSDILRHAGHRTAIVHSGNAALAQLAITDYDLILSDLHMPDLNGLDLYRQVQTSHPHLLERLVFITGDVLGSTVRSFLAETGVPSLEKPVIPREVLSLVRRLLQRLPTDET